jgi:hypothetical protein
MGHKEICMSLFQGGDHRYRAKLTAERRILTVEITRATPPSRWEVFVLQKREEGPPGARDGIVRFVWQKIPFPDLESSAFEP